MTRLLIILIAIVQAGFAQAQENSPTLEQTIEYIQKKMEEVDGLKSDYGELNPIYNDFLFRMEEDKSIFLYFNTTEHGSRKYIAGIYSYYFNPLDISGIMPATLTEISDFFDGNKVNEDVGFICIKFKSRSAKEVEYGGDIMVDKIYMPYLNTDNTNFEKLQKAFLHLQKLYLSMKEDDPFAN